MAEVDVVSDARTHPSWLAMLRRQRWFMPIILVGILLVVYPFVLQSAFARDLGVLALIFAIAATGWNVLGGYAGQVSFGHAVFFGTGAYATAILTRHGWSPWLTLPVGAVISAALGLLLGLATFHLRGHYFSIATIAAGVIAATVATNVGWLGGAEGLSLPVREFSVWNMSFSIRDSTPYYFLALLFFVLASVATVMFVRGRTGVYVRSIRDNIEAASSIGIPVRNYKLRAIALSAAITAIAGSLYAVYVLFVDPASTLELTLSIFIALSAVLGGAGSLWGPLLGAWVLTFLQHYTQVYLSSLGRSPDLLIYGAIIVAIMVIEPGGLIGLLTRGRRSRGRFAIKVGSGRHRNRSEQGQGA